jgi:hypothetical protein
MRWRRSADTGEAPRCSPANGNQSATHRGASGWCRAGPSRCASAPRRASIGTIRPHGEQAGGLRKVDGAPETFSPAICRSVVSAVHSRRGSVLRSAAAARERLSVPPCRRNCKTGTAMPGLGVVAHRGAATGASEVVRCHPGRSGNRVLGAAGGLRPAVGAEQVFLVQEALARIAADPGVRAWREAERSAVSDRLWSVADG